LKEYVRLIENQSRRLLELEKVHADLENRLEEEHTERIRLEHTLEKREVAWKQQVEELNLERDGIEKIAKEEKLKVQKLLDMVNRLQNEIQSMIKNKFSHPMGSQHHPHGRNEGNANLNPGGLSGGGIKRVPSAQASGAGSSGISEKRNSPGNTSNGSMNQPGSAGPNQNSASRMGRHIGPHEILAHNGSAKAVRERNAMTSLLDFFGM